MMHWIIMPVILPAMLAPFIILAARYHIGIQRVFSVAGVIGLIAIATGLFWQALDGTVTLYQLGDWPAPFGIVVVGDRLSTMMVLLTAVMSLFVLLYAIGTKWDEEGRHFHALFQFLIMGIMGAFLTGDLFNLFVFFEVLLIASYGLMIHSGGRERLRVGTQYVLYNLIGSTLFLFALGSLYAETGTLNMADLAVRLTSVSPEETVGIRITAVLLLLVFAIKAALVPVHFWLPSSYSEAPGPVAALFAIMTKVGAYAIIRTYTLAFPPELEATAGLHGTWLLPLALISVTLGAAGVLAARKLDRLIAFSVIGSMGMVMVAISLFDEAGIAAALYYIVHSTFATATLFLIADLVRRGRGSVDLVPQPPMVGAVMVSALFFAAAIAMAGLPPLSGFVGKILILEAGYESTQMVWIWAVILISSLVSVVGFSRAGSVVFWKAKAKDTVDQPSPGETQSTLSYIAVGGLLSMLAVTTLLAGPLHGFAERTSSQLFAPQEYVTVVTQTPGKLTRPKPEGYGEDGHDDDGHAAEGQHVEDSHADDVQEGH